MTSMMKRVLMAAFVGILALSVVPSVAWAAEAEADPVDDALLLVDEALKCRVWADEPGGNPVRGSGGGTAISATCR